MKETTKKFLNLHQNVSPLGTNSSGTESRPDKVLVSNVVGSNILIVDLSKHN